MENSTKLGIGLGLGIFTLLIFVLAVPGLLLGLFFSSGSGTFDEQSVPAEYHESLLLAGSICEAITPPVLAAQIEAESNWGRNRLSTAGASGISQFMPATWVDHGYKSGSHTEKGNINNDADQIWSQGKYMCYLHGEVTKMISNGTISGDPLRLTYASYNAGLGSVMLWGGIPEFDETIQYVDKIMASLAGYTASYTPNIGIAGNMNTAVEWAKTIAADKTNFYVMGGTGPKGYDCSGLTQAAYQRLKISLPRTAHQQALDGRGVSIPALGAAQPGDLLFWGSPGYYYHTAIYAGNGYMVSADSEVSGINFEPVYGTVALIKRFPTNNPS